jgi:pimeloyl-ACP methyl ester carboxylesterase
VADTLYAPCGDLSLAYQVFGDGPVELVVHYGPITHVELAWAVPEVKAFFDQLATFCRVLVFDKAGVGLSDPVPHVRTLDERAAEIEAVMDAAGFGQAVLFALSEGGPAAIMFAATRPERTRALILYGTLACMEAGWDDIDRDPDELLAQARAELGEDFMPSVEQITRRQEFARAVRSAWGTGAALSIAIPSARASMRQLAMFERMCASPGMARASFEAMFRIDVRPILPTITVPTLVIHAREDPSVPVQFGLHLADHIPGAVPRGRRELPNTPAHRARQDPDRDRGVPHRQPCRTVAVPSRPAQRAVH